MRPFCCFQSQGKPCCSGSVHSNSNTALNLALVIKNSSYGFIGIELNLLMTSGIRKRQARDVAHGNRVAQTLLSVQVACNLWYTAGD